MAKQQTKGNDTEKAAEWELTQIFFKVMEVFSEFNADHVYEAAREKQLSPVYLQRHIGAMFKRFVASGYIKKTGTYALSERNGSSPLPIYTRSLNGK